MNRRSANLPPHRAPDYCRGVPPKLTSRLGAGQFPAAPIGTRNYGKTRRVLIALCQGTVSSGGETFDGGIDRVHKMARHAARTRVIEHRRLHCRVAQLVAQPAHNRKVAGSNPASAPNFLSFGKAPEHYVSRTVNRNDNGSSEPQNSGLKLPSALPSIPHWSGSVGQILVTARLGRNNSSGASRSNPAAPTFLTTTPYEHTHRSTTAPSQIFHQKI